MPKPYVPAVVGVPVTRVRSVNRRMLSRGGSAPAVTAYVEVQVALVVIAATARPANVARELSARRR